MLNDRWSAEAIRALRRRLKLTQQQFAVKVGVSIGVVSRWETGGATPSNLAAAALDLLREKRRERGGAA